MPAKPAPTRRGVPPAADPLKAVITAAIRKAVELNEPRVAAWLRRLVGPGSESASGTVKVLTGGRDEP